VDKPVFKYDSTENQFILLALPSNTLTTMYRILKANLSRGRTKRNFVS